jgi:acetoin utilization protein AcuB
MSANALHPVHQFPTIRQHMTASPHTISPRQPLTIARRTMLDQHIRHLPVLDGGRVVGLLSERDLLLVESLPGVNPTDVRVEEAMVQSVFTATPDEPVAEVVQTMVQRKLGSAVVVEGERVVGVFTTTDALRALAEILERR